MEGQGGEIFHFTYAQRLSTSPSQIKHFTIYLNLETQSNEWFWDRGTGELVQTYTYTQDLQCSIIRFNREKLVTSFENLKERIFEDIDVWTITDDLRESLAIKILSDTAEIVESERDRPKLTISCTVTLVENRILNLEEIGPSMVPASNHSIESLESRRMVATEDGSNETCRICLEDLPVECEVLCMPCSHVFHGDCIRQWLNTSHFCPICRYAMPTN